MYFDFKPFVSAWARGSSVHWLLPLFLQSVLARRLQQFFYWEHKDNTGQRMMWNLSGEWLLDLCMLPHGIDSLVGLLGNPGFRVSCGCLMGDSVTIEHAFRPRGKMISR